ncbi:hypothetical protein Verru16b_03226 [Lacunisphaera limnophila]|uniref:Uncharacterized protein n=1 Tax=Lacunisphaera limnophila TaxID=1838286 RepID=A0A1D8AZ08_9BACT|nr:hypothetical protein [Lacunisphaera limnophila]AOS46130.1 hypothetical protein Verru16b_03226 [Lacunisphaera limnophila]
MKPALFPSSALNVRILASSLGAFLKSALQGLLAVLLFALLWWLAYLLEWAPAPALEGLIGAFLPVLHDLGQFAGFNLTHNLPFVLLAAGLFVSYEMAFRRQVAAGVSPAGTLSLFKAASLLLGLFTMAISLYGVLTVSGEQGQDARALIGSLYFKFGLWVLNAVLMVARFVWFEHTQPAQTHA